jgi:putative sulfotransferase
LPGRLTAQTLRERARDVERYRGLCAFLASEAEQAIADARPQELLTMTYEDLVDDPLTQLGRLGRFLDFDDWEQWAQGVVGAVEARSRGQGSVALADRRMASADRSSPEGTGCADLRPRVV